MATITVRNLDPKTVERLKQRAKVNSRSLEAEVRRLLDLAVRAPQRDGALDELAGLLDSGAVRRAIHPASRDARPVRKPSVEWSPARALADDVLEGRETT